MLSKPDLKTGTVIFFLIAFAALVRVLYSGIHPQIILTPDSAIYYDLAVKMFSEPSVKLLISPFKTPLYGLTIYSVMLLFNDKPALAGSPEFFNTSQHLIFFQQIIGITGVLILFSLAFRITKSGIFSSAIAFFHSVNLLNLPWERAMLSESLGTFWILVFTYILVLNIQKQKLINLICFFIISALGFLLRPAFVLIPIFGMFFIAVHTKKLDNLKISALVLFFYLTVIYFFTALNFQNWHYRGIQITGDINLLGKVLQYDLPTESVKDQTYFYQIVKDYRSRSLPLHPYRLLDYYDPGIYINFPKLENLRRFSRRIIADNIWVYLYKSAMLLPQALSQIDPAIGISGKTGGMNIISLLSFEQIFFGLLQLAGLINIVVLPYYLYKLFTKSLTLNGLIITAISALTVEQVFLSVFLSYEEYGRLITVVSPLILLTTFHWLKIMINKPGFWRFSSGRLGQIS